MKPVLTIHGEVGKPMATIDKAIHCPFCSVYGKKHSELMLNDYEVTGELKTPGNVLPPTTRIEMTCPSCNLILQTSWIEGDAQ